MLKIINKNPLSLLNKFTKNFGSSGGPVNVTIDKNATWLKYNSVHQHLRRIES